MFTAWPDRVSTTEKKRIRGPRALLLGLLIAAGMFALIVGLRGHLGYWMAENWRAELDQVSDDRVPVLLAGVAELGEPGIPVLVEAFGSERECVARAGKQILIEEISRWELLASPEASRRLATLAEALADQIDQFGPTAKSDAAELATRILLWPLDEKSVDRGRVTQCCDRILRVSAPQRGALDGRHRPDGMTRMLVGGDPAESYGANLDPPEVDATAVAADSKPKALPLYEPPSIVQVRGDDRDIATRLHVANDSQGEPSKQIGIKAPTLERIAQLFSMGDKTAPQTQASSSAADTKALDHSAEPDPVADSLRRAATITVMRQLRSADQRVATAAKVELAGRGFSAAHLALAQRLFDPDPSIRKQVGRAALETPDINPIPWLVELSRDDDPQVRLTAVTLMATTGDPTLMKKIEDISRRDTSEQVRRQAQQITAQRRQTMY
jgi:hypothetical protein